jgi:SAM-dependent methyltransferase
MSASDYWKNNASLVHLTPTGVRWPEKGLFPALTKACRGKVFELGCGDGRLSPAFSARKYVGMDINPVALEAARQNNPKHTYSEEWEPADTVLAYTVLLHVSDEDLPDTIEMMLAYERIVIGEVTGRKWRRRGDPPVFNREPEEYADMIGRTMKIIPVPYPRYKCDLSLMVFE